MDTRYGVLDWRMVAEGSKSEGHRAVLRSDDGQEYILYRAGMLPAGDTFFAPYAGQQLTAKGAVEMTGDRCYLCVDSLVLSDGKVLSAQPENLFAPGPIFIKKVVPVEDSRVVESPKRLPRKLKKQLKKNK